MLAEEHHEEGLDGLAAVQGALCANLEPKQMQVDIPSERCHMLKGLPCNHKASFTEQACNPFQWKNYLSSQAKSCIDRIE
jgi:hypothetical protein